MKKSIIFILFIIFFSNLISDTNFRVMTYNSLMFSVYSGQSRFSDFETVFDEVNPDIVIMQEIEDEPGSDLMLNILNSDEIEFTRAEFVDDGDLNNMLYYKTSKATLISQDVVNTYPRDISEYVIEIDGNQIRIYSCHLKASQGYEQQRLTAVTILRNHLNQFEQGTEFIIAGDMNFYTSSEPAYQKFIADETNNTGRSKDWSDLVGNWHNNQDFSEAHSQSSRTNQFGGGVGGGLDDRFDFIFTYYEINNNAEIEFIEGSLVAVGNDGNHFNQSINYGTNSAVSSEVADALYYASDHLPAYADFISLSSNIAIADIQTTPDGEEGDSPLLGQDVQVTALVTGIFGSGYFIQDNVGPWNGIYVYDSSDFPEIGDEINISATVVEYYNKTELIDITSYEGISIGNPLPNSYFVSTGDVSHEKFEGVLVEVLNAECVYDDIGYGEWIVDDGSGEAIIDDLMYSFIPTVGDVYEICGIVDYAFYNYKIEPRDVSDIVLQTSTDEYLNNIKVNLQNYPNPFNPTTTIYFTAEDAKHAEIIIYNLKGHKIRQYSIFNNQSSIVWDGRDHNNNPVSSGIYFIKLKVGKSIFLKKTILLK